MSRGWYKNIGVFCGVLLVWWALSFVSVLAPFFHAIESSLYSVSASAGRAVGRFFAREDALSSQLQICSGKLGSAVVAAADVDARQREVEEWRALMGYTTREKKHGVAARVIARDTPNDAMVTIDRGADDGIKLGSAVIIGDGILFGTIASLQTNVATVRLTEHGESSIPGTIQGAQNTLGLVNGQEGALLLMEYIPQETVIEENAIVVTSGLGGHIPQGIVIGTVTSVIREASAPFIRASITPIHDPREWTSVMVLPYPEETL